MSKLHVRNPQLYLLDFDGVVIESTDIKTNAFYELYKNYGEEVAQKAKGYHLENQGISRFKKFKAIHKLFLEKECFPDEIEKLSSDFTEIVFKSILQAPFVEGVISFLEAKREENIPVFLLSATPEEELSLICHQRKIHNFFSGIFGFPQEKALKGREIMQRLGVDPSNVVFLGDSLQDYRAAIEIGVPFIGVVQDVKKNPFPLHVGIVSNFNRLKANNF